MEKVHRTLYFISKTMTEVYQEPETIPEKNNLAYLLGDDG